MAVGASAVGVLQEDVEVAVAIHQHLVLDYAALLEVLQLNKGQTIVVELEYPLGLLLPFLFIGFGKAAQNESNVFADSDYHEATQGNRQLKCQQFEPIVLYGVLFNRI